MSLKLLVSDEKFWADYQKRLAELDAKVPPATTEMKAESSTTTAGKCTPTSTGFG